METLIPKYVRLLKYWEKEEGLNKEIVGRVCGKCGFETIWLEKRGFA